MKRVWGLILWALCIAIILSGTAFAKERQGNVSVQVNVNAPSDAKRVRVWIPYPMSDRNQDITGINLKGNYTSIGVYKDQGSQSAILYAEWLGSSANRTLSYDFHVRRNEVTNADLPKTDTPLSKKEFIEYLDNSWLGPTEQKIKTEAEKITAGKTTALGKARTIYDWIVDNMRRNPDAKACGNCNVEKLLTERTGKCADVHTVFVSLCRAAGIPARDVWGIRIPKTSEGDMTKMQHCWAEFYLAGYGWVPVDAADVHKIILDRKLTTEEAKKLADRNYFFGNIEENRIQLGYAHGTLSPPQDGGSLIYFMYPYAEADGKPLGEDINHNFGYKITFRQ